MTEMYRSCHTCAWGELSPGRYPCSDCDAVDGKPSQFVPKTFADAAKQQLKTMFDGKNDEAVDKIIDEHPLYFQNYGEIDSHKQNESTKDVGTKYDDGKLRWDLLPYGALTEVVKVFTEGAKKYNDRNWEKGIDYHRIFRAAFGHAVSFWEGKDINTEDFGLHHLAHAVTGFLMLLHYQLNEQYARFDDRPKEGEE